MQCFYKCNTISNRIKLKVEEEELITIITTIINNYSWKRLKKLKIAKKILALKIGSWQQTTTENKKTLLELI